MVTFPPMIGMTGESNVTTFQLTAVNHRWNSIANTLNGA